MNWVNLGRCINYFLITAANVHDTAVTEGLLYGKEKRRCGDAGYQGIDKREAHDILG